MPDRFELECPGCKRKGFAWARPVCQYCGHAIPEAPPDLEAARERLDAVYEAAERDYEKTMEDLRRRDRPAADHVDGVTCLPLDVLAPTEPAPPPSVPPDVEWSSG